MYRIFSLLSIFLANMYITWVLSAQANTGDIDICVYTNHFVLLTY